MSNKKSYLTGKLLLSMPVLGDSIFNKAVIYICSHDENGAMGIMINKTIYGLDFNEVLKQFGIFSDITVTEKIISVPVMSGGPVETARGFLLHTNDYFSKDTSKIDDGIGITGTIEFLKDVASGSVPENMIFALGYSGWSAGQLEEEIRQNAWLTLDADEDLLFNETADDKWDRAIKKLGINPATLSLEAGTA